MSNRKPPAPSYECIANSAAAIDMAKAQIAELRLNLDGTLHQIERSTGSIKSSLALLDVLNERRSLPGRQVQASADGEGPETPGREAGVVAAMPTDQPEPPETE